MSEEKIWPHHLERKALLYVRQSSAHQVLHNEESRRLQYAMQLRLQSMGWNDVVVIDEDLGRSATTTVGRVGFQQGGHGWMMHEGRQSRSYRSSIVVTVGKMAARMTTCRRLASSHEHLPSAFQNLNDLQHAALAYAGVRNVRVHSRAEVPAVERQ